MALNESTSLRERSANSTPRKRFEDRDAHSKGTWRTIPKFREKLALTFPARGSNQLVQSSEPNPHLHSSTNKYSPRSNPTHTTKRIAGEQAPNHGATPKKGVDSRAWREQNKNPGEKTTNSSRKENEQDTAIFAVLFPLISSPVESLTWRHTPACLHSALELLHPRNLHPRLGLHLIQL